MKISSAPLQRMRRLPFMCSAVLMLLLALATGAQAQSTDVEFPTPIRTNEISGTISPRDVGDSRLTRYFYSLTGTSGDLVVTVESRNLNGDVDLFTSGGLRPLAKLTMYAGETANGTSRTIYFKRNEALILRVEARSPNDNEGSFRIHFEGAFSPFMGEAREPEPLRPGEPQPATINRGTKRVTATGARIDEPVVETAEKTSEAESSPTRTPNVATRENPADTPEPTAATNGTEPPRTSPRPTRTRRPRAPRAATPRATTTARPRPAPTARAGQPPAPPEQPARQPTATTPPATVAAGPRLIIETKDGLRVERYMTSVRRVTVDNGQVIVILKNGKVERQPMTNVLKMSIEP